MQKPADETVTGDVPLAVRWHRLRTAYRICNLATHHVLGFTIKLVLLVYFAFALLFLCLRYVVLPNIDHYKADIERAASHAVGNPVTIARIYASWNGLRPSLFLGDVSLRDSEGAQVLALPSVSATLSWWSVPTASVRFESLELIRPQLSMRRDTNGKLYVAGLTIDPRQKSDGKGADWLLSQRELVIREGRIDWNDQLRGAPPLVLDNVSVVLRNKWRRHQFALRATPPDGLAAPLDVRADLSHPAFTAHSSNMALWKGHVYADFGKTDLAAWKPWLTYPFELSSGQGALRAWLELDQGRLSALTADVRLANVAAVLGRDLPPLDLRQLSGRIAAREDRPVPSRNKAAAQPMFGARGHSIELSNLTLTTNDGLVLAPTSLSERFHAAAGAAPEKMELAAPMLDLQTMAGLAERLPLTAHQRATLAGFAPRGKLLNFSAQWSGVFPALQSYRVKGELAGLGLKPQPPQLAQPKTARSPAIAGMPAIPGFDNLSGAIDASDQGGSVSLDSSALVLRMPDYFAEPSMPFDKLSLKARWSFEPEQQLLVRVDAFDFVQKGLTGSLSGTHLLPLAGKGPGKVDLTGRLNGFEINTIDRFLPMQTPHELRAWLTGALEGGIARDVSVRLRGELAHFPFNGATAAERARGEFRVAGKLDNGKLNYSPNHFAHDRSGRETQAPLWPQAEHIKGSFVFDRTRMEIRGETATTGGVALSGVKAVIADLGSHDSTLEIDGAAAGPMQEFLNYMAASPVLEWISHFTDETRASGNAKLALHLQLPLAHLLDSKVQGALQLQGNDVLLLNDLPPVTAALGKIEFNERGVNLNALSGNFLGGPVAISGGTQHDNAIIIKLAGNVTADGLRRNYPFPAMQRLADHLSGGTRFNGLVTVREHQMTVAVDSTLAGLGLDLPAPVSKAAADAMPLRFVLNSALLPAADGMLHDDIRIGLGGAIAAHYQRQKKGYAAWRLSHGGIGVNAPTPEPDSGLGFNISLHALNVDNWLDFGAKVAGPAEPGTGALVAATDTVPAADDIDIAQYLIPDSIATRASELVVGERKLENVVLGMSRQKNLWQASIDSSQANGYLTWNVSPTGQGLGKVTARLSSLVIPESAAGEVQELLDGKSAAASIPALDIVSERFELFNKPLGRLELQASNTLMASGGAGTGAREWRVNKLSLVNPDGQLHGSGKWTTREGVQHSSLDFALDIADAGRLLDRMGFAGTLKGGKGKLTGDIAWTGLPYSLDTPSLSGQIAMNVEKGQFLKQDPGAAKLLGVLSLQALPRLLKLDFHDVFSEGLAFDGITANATVSHGIAKTDNLKMHGVAATVLMDGSADIANETTNLHVVVIPQVNLGTAPLVYALAVNPVIGLGSFLAQQFLSAPVMKALTYHMQVTGPWKAPVVAKLDGARPEAPAAQNVAH